MKRIALALIACAGLGYVAGQKPSTSADVAVVVPAVVTPEVNDNKPDVIVPPVETPWVENLLPKKKVPPKGTEHLVGDRDFFIDRNANLYIDGQRTKNGFFEYEVARNIFVPVDHGHPRYDYNDAPVTLEHLIAEHGHARSSASKWTRAEIEIAHANSHFLEKMNAARAAAPVRSSGCPGGVCPSPSRGGLFRRR